MNLLISADIFNSTVRVAMVVGVLGVKVSLSETLDISKYININTTVDMKAKCEKIASEMPVPHSLEKYFQHHEI